MKFNSLDEAQGVFFERELEFVKAQTYDIKRPNNSYSRAFPIDTSAGAGADTISYQQYDSVGVMKLISSSADDLPRSDIKGKEFLVKVKTIGGSYGYNYDEVLAGMMASNFSGSGPKKSAGFIDTKRALASRRSYDNKMNEIAWFANPNEAKWQGLVGFLYFPNIPITTASTKVGGGTVWSGATGEEILADMTSAINAVTTITNGVEVVDTIGLPPAQYALLRSKMMTQLNTTVKKHFQETYPDIKIESFPELKAVTPLPSTGVGSGDMMVAYTRSPDHIQLNVP